MSGLWVFSRWSPRPPGGPSLFVLMVVVVAMLYQSSRYYDLMGIGRCIQDCSLF